jgi:hypothetical protein
LKHLSHVIPHVIPVIPVIPIIPIINPKLTLADDTSIDDFKSSGYNLRENTNSLTASRDTNISPGEAYDVISLPQIRAAVSSSPRALDVGCGAGVSTEILWKMGFKDIDAIDWSADAWKRFVVEGGKENERGENECAMYNVMFICKRITNTFSQNIFFLPSLHS